MEGARGVVGFLEWSPVSTWCLDPKSQYMTSKVSYGRRHCIHSSKEPNEMDKIERRTGVERKAPRIICVATNGNRLSSAT